MLSGYLRLHRRVLWRPARVEVHPAEARDGVDRGEADRVRRDRATVCDPAHAGRLWELRASVSHMFRVERH